MASEKNTATPGAIGVVAFLKQLEDGGVLLVMNDVKATSTTEWKTEVTFTERRFDEREVREVSTPDSELADIGLALMSRLSSRWTP